MSNYIPKKIDLTPKRHHGYSVLLFILGSLFPPLAVAARFGIGLDFWLNLLLTICGYIPGHVHNFYIQNVRNNKNHARTPKWAQRYGLIDTSDIKRKERRSQWANRYQDRLPTSTLEGQAYEEGQEHGSSVDMSLEGGPRQQRGNGNGEHLWREDEESYYGNDANSTSSAGRWHYPANFEDAAPASKAKKGKKKKDKKDRWARTDDAYSLSEQTSAPKKKMRRKKSKSSLASGSIDETNDFPESAEGGLYGDHEVRDEPPTRNGRRTTDDDVFQHEF